MIHILLTILKIMGITLLVLLCLLLAVVLCILFVPVRYRLRAGINEASTVELLKNRSQEAKDDIQLKADITWLAGLLHIRAQYENSTFFFQIKAAVFTILSSEKSEKEEKAAKKKQRFKPEEKKEAAIEPIPKQTVQKTGVRQEEQKKPSSKGSAASAQAAGEKHADSSVVQEQPEKPEKSEKEKKSIEERIDELQQRMQSILDTVNDPDNRELVSFLLVSIKKLLLHIKPQKYYTYLYLGMEDPSVTGQLYGAFCVINTILDSKIEFTPDFERKIMRLSAGILGRIRVWNLLIIGCRIYFNKTFKKLIGGK
jgi:hypothetical protein